MKNYYRILGIDSNASREQIKLAYRKLAKQYHPDVNQEDPQSAERFKQIGEAYQTLSDPQLRWRYDHPQEAIRQDFDAVWKNSYSHRKAKLYRMRKNRRGRQVASTVQTVKQLMTLVFAFTVLVWTWWPSPPRKQSLAKEDSQIAAVEMAYQQCRDLVIQEKVVEMPIRAEVSTAEMLENVIGTNLEGFYSKAEVQMRAGNYAKALDLYLTLWLNERYFPPLPKTRDYVRLAYEHLPFLEQDKVLDELRENGFNELAYFLSDGDLAKM